MALRLAPTRINLALLEWLTQDHLLQQKLAVESNPRLSAARLRTARGGNQGQNRKPKPSAKGKGPRKNQRRNATSFENAEGEEAEAAAIEAVEQEQILKDRPVPIRYEPQDITYSTLRETWPSIPTDANSRSAAVYEKLASLSGRFANGYVPPHELGRRLWKGQSVLFSSEAEKAEALEETKRLAQLRADRISQRKGDLVEPRTVEFNPIDAESTKTLMETLAQGKYPTAEAKKGGTGRIGRGDKKSHEQWDIPNNWENLSIHGQARISCLWQHQACMILCEDGDQW